MAAPSRAIKLFGTEEAVPVPRPLRAGPLAVDLVGTALRHLRFDGREILRGIDFLVRDSGWGTFAPRVEETAIDERPDAFVVAFAAECGDAAQRFAYRLRIEGRADGSLTVEARGAAAAPFTANRIAFVVLHPIVGVAGEPVRVERADGSVEEARFPAAIDPAQPFKNIRALTHKVGDLAVTCAMEGELFEMEDQRNWGDASFKTYGRPLAEPWPFTLRPGEEVAQHISVRVRGAPAPAALRPAPDAVPDAAGVTVTVGAPTGGTLPRVALTVPVEAAPLALQSAGLLASAGFRAFVATVMDGVIRHNATAVRRRLEAYAALVRELGQPVETVLNAVLPCRDADGRPAADATVLRADLNLLREVVTAAGVGLDCVMATPGCDLASVPPGSPWPPAPAWAELAAGLRATFPGIAVGGGMLSFFTEFNRKPPPLGLFDFLGHALSPLVHSGDDLSLTEGLEALPAIFASAQAIIGERPYWLFPSAIAMAHNPYGPAPVENGANGRRAMARVDPRERALIGAAWYAGCLAHAARAGLDTVCLAAAVGPSGIICSRQPWAQPWFDGGAAVVFPSWHVLREHARCAGAPLHAAESSRPRDVQALAHAVNGGGMRLWLSNLTGSERRVRVDGVAVRGGELRRIDEGSFVHLCCRPDGFAAVATALEGDAVALPAYATACLSFPA